MNRNVNHKSLRQRVGRHWSSIRIVSFDIFDTAVCRFVFRPVDLFHLTQLEFERRMGRDLEVCLLSKRQQAEELARRRNLAKQDVTLDEIYVELEKRSGLDSATCQALKQIEQELELGLSYPNPIIHSWYRECLEAGKEIVFLSDMYLPHGTVDAIVRKCGYTQFRSLYLSSQLGVTKHSGDLFDYVLKDLSCLPREILHVGDNEIADCQRPSQKGWRAIHLPLPEVEDDETQDSEKTPAASVRLALLRKRLLSMPPSKSKEFWTELGYAQVGILYLGFTLWLVENLKRQPVGRVFFLARDGYSLKRCYDYVAARARETLPPSEYLYVSRRALHIPTMTTVDESAIKLLTAGATLQRVSDFLLRAGLNITSQTVHEKIIAAGFRSPSVLIDSQETRNKLERLFCLLEPEILEIAGRERKLLLSYLNETRVLDEREFAVVDAGWYGSLQKSLERLCELGGGSARIDGYYLGTFPGAEKNSGPRSSLKGFLFDKGRPEPLCATACYSLAVIESLLNAPHGSVVGFRPRGEGAEPIFQDNPKEIERGSFAEQVQVGALEFVGDFLRLLEGVPSLRVTPSDAFRPIGRILARPTLQEATTLGDLHHSDGFGDSVSTRIAHPRAMIWRWLKPKFSEHYRSYWQIGYELRRWGRLLGVDATDGALARRANLRAWFRGQDEPPKALATDDYRIPPLLSGMVNLQDLNNITFRCRSRVIGPWIDKVRRFAYRLLWVVFQRQTSHNQAVHATFELILQEIAKQQKEISELRRALSASRAADRSEDNAAGVPVLNSTQVSEASQTLI